MYMKSIEGKLFFLNNDRCYNNISKLCHIIKIILKCDFPPMVLTLYGQITFLCT